MPEKSDAEVIQEVSQRIDQAIVDNRRHERIIVAILVLLFSVGLGLVIYGAVLQEWSLLVPGGFLQVMIALPIRRLIKLREENMRLQILPQLLRLAHSDEAKMLAAKLASRLIEQV